MDMPNRIYAERDPETNAKHWYSTKGMGVEYVRADEVELLRVANAALRHGLQCIADQPGWTDHHARAAGILRQVPNV